MGSEDVPLAEADCLGNGNIYLAAAHGAKGDFGMGQTTDFSAVSSASYGVRAGRRLPAWTLAPAGAHLVGRSLGERTRAPGETMANAAHEMRGARAHWLRGVRIAAG